MTSTLQKLFAGGIAVGVVALILAISFNLHGQPGIGNAQGIEIPPPAPVAVQAPAATAPTRSETVVFAGGCFWGVQGVFQHIKGVRSAVSGYTGGSAATASYHSSVPAAAATPKPCG